MTKKSNTEEFIKKARKVHGNKYDYSKVNYLGWNKKIIIICPIHGEFQQSPHNHIKGHSQDQTIKKGTGCPECTHHKPLNNEIFIERAKEVHGNTYNYDKV